MLSSQSLALSSASVPPSSSFEGCSSMSISLSWDSLSLLLSVSAVFLPAASFSAYGVSLRFFPYHSTHGYQCAYQQLLGMPSGLLPSSSPHEVLAHSSVLVPSRKRILNSPFSMDSISRSEDSNTTDFCWGAEATFAVLDFGRLSLKACNSKPVLATATD